MLGLIWVGLAPGRAATLPAGFIEQSIGSGWNSPAGIAYDTSGPSNRLYVWERAGKVWIVENGEKLAAPMVDISDEVMTWRDFGLLSIALDPQFQQNGFIYLLYVVDRHYLLNFGTANYDPTANLYAPPSIGRITRYTARFSDGLRSVDPSSRRVLVGEAINKGFPILHESHGVGSLVFGTDGTLLASCGDAASYTTRDDGGADGGSTAPQAVTEGILTSKENVGAFRSQLVDSLSGKIIRIDPGTGDGISSNPYFDGSNPRSAKSRVWTLGLRNPYRMALRPGTGSHVRADANPGVIYLGDVGWSTWEDLHVVAGPGTNCGWPLYEGLEAQGSYQASPAINLDAPNPLGGYFKFKDLLIQETLGTPSWPNPLNPAQQIPAGIPKWVHTRPIIDYNHSQGPARTGVFNGNTAAVSNLGDAGCPVAGPTFGGNAATGGMFFTTNDFPPTYRGTYFHADFVGHWIKSMVVDANDRPTEVRAFASATGPIVFVGTHPAAGGLHYVTFDGNVRRIVYAPGGNQPPIAAGAVAPGFGASPLAVQFNAAGSYDPDGSVLSYLWSFDDGTTSSQPSPSKTFAAAATRKFNVTLRVTDAGGASNTVAVPVFVNHAPPAVNVTSPVNGAKYPVGANTNYPLTATITPQPGHPVTSTWQTLLHHDSHVHPDAPASGPNANVLTGGEGVGFFYENILTVTDDLGLKVINTVNLLPNLTNAPPAIAWSQTSREVSAGTVTRLDSAAVTTDGDSPGMEGGALRVELIGGSTNETLGLRSEGNGPGQIELSGTTVNFGAVAVGTLNIANNRSPLVVTLNASATPAAAQAILRNVTYLSTLERATPRIVRATLADGDGGTSVATDLAVTARSGNLAPAVQITGPVPGALFSAPATVVINAGATDADGTVTRVDFFRGSTKLGTDGSAPYTFTWNNVPAGTYNLRARAVDNSGAKSWSTTVQIRVTAAVSTLLADDFDDNTRNTAKWSLGSVAATIYGGAAAIDPSVAVAERAQRLEIPLRAGLNGDHYNGYLATTARDFTDASASVEVVQPAAGLADTILTVSNDVQNLLMMVVEGGDLYLDHIANGARNITGLPYNPTQHRYWRIRHVAAQPAIICFETSADGVNWQTLRKDNQQFAITALRPELSAGTWEPAAAPGVAIFDNFKMERGGIAPPAPENEAPIADPAGPYSATANQPVTLTAADSIDFDGTISGYAWTFGDGTTGSGASVTKIYTNAGAYTVLLRVTDNLGAFSEETTTVLVSGPDNQPPTARPGGAYSGMVGQAIAFNGAASSDSDGSITSYAWNFGDGATGSGPTPTHVYASPGTFTITLTVTDNGTATHAATTTATIVAVPVNQPPIARPGGPYTGTIGAIVAFNGATSSDPDGSIGSYAWNFGDGTTGAGPTPTHTYSQAGTFTTVLTVTDNTGATDTANVTATITDTAPVTLLADDFNDNVRDSAKWRLGAVVAIITSGNGAVDPLVSVLERNGRLEIVPRSNVGGDHYYGYVSNRLDLTGASVRVRALQAPGGDTDAFLALSVDSQNFAMMGSEGPYLFFDQTVAGGRDLTVISYNPTAHRHWRIQHFPATDTIAFATSADGTTWVTQRESPRRLALAAIAIELSAGTWQPESAPGVAIFDDLVAERP